MHKGVKGNSLSSGMDSSSTLASQWTHRLVSLFVSPAISALKYDTLCWDSVVQAGVGGASTEGEHWGVLGCGGSFGTSWGSKTNTGSGGRLKLRLRNKSDSKDVNFKKQKCKTTLKSDQRQQNTNLGVRKASADRGVRGSNLKGAKPAGAWKIKPFGAKDGVSVASSAGTESACGWSVTLGSGLEGGGGLGGHGFSSGSYTKRETGYSLKSHVKHSMT